MSKLQETLDRAFKLLDEVMFKGCDAEKVADIKILLREAFRLAGLSEEETNNGGQDHR